jgi:CheY-like chemotaxis protein
MRILLAEDDRVNQKITTQFMAGWNMQIEIANNGEEALKMLADRHFDLVLMDLDMPLMDGVSTTYQIRHSGAPYHNIPIFAFTASTEADTCEKARALLMNDFVCKPLNPGQLLCKINEHVIQPLVEPRPINIRFDHFQGSDAKFRYDLTLLMTQNIRELEEALFKSFYGTGRKDFHAAAHRVKSTLILLNDHEYDYLVDNLKEGLQGNDRKVLADKINRFSILSESIIKSLGDYLHTLKHAAATTT